jgi:hypothetical protein
VAGTVAAGRILKKGKKQGGFFARPGKDRCRYICAAPPARWRPVEY